jgi:hypothetical protein
VHFELECRMAGLYTFYSPIVNNGKIYNPFLSPQGHVSFAKRDLTKLLAEIGSKTLNAHFYPPILQSIEGKSYHINLALVKFPHVGWGRDLRNFSKIYQQKNCFFCVIINL